MAYVLRHSLATPIITRAYSMGRVGGIKKTPPANNIVQQKGGDERVVYISHHQVPPLPVHSSTMYPPPILLSSASSIFIGMFGLFFVIFSSSTHRTSPNKGEKKDHWGDM